MKSILFILFTFSLNAIAANLPCESAQTMLLTLQKKFQASQINLEASYTQCAQVPVPKACMQAFQDHYELTLQQLRQAGLERNHVCETTSLNR